MFGPKIKVDPGLHRRAADYAARKGYSSLDDLVSRLLERELRSGPAPEGTEQDDMKDRLQGLGYIS